MALGFVPLYPRPKRVTMNDDTCLDSNDNRLHKMTLSSRSQTREPLLAACSNDEFT